MKKHNRRKVYEPQIIFIFIGPLPPGNKTMYKVKKGFFLANGFEGKVDALVTDDTFNKSEIASLTKDGSIEKAKLGSGTATNKPVAKKVATKPKKKVK